MGFFSSCFTSQQSGERPQDSDATIKKLRQLKTMFDEGLIDEDEFKAEKKMVLESKRTKQHKVKQDVAEACTLESEPRRQKVNRPAKRPQERAHISALIDKDLRRSLTKDPSDTDADGVDLSAPPPRLPNSGTQDSSRIAVIEKDRWSLRVTPTGLAQLELAPRAAAAADDPVSSALAESAAFCADLDCVSGLGGFRPSAAEHADITALIDRDLRRSLTGTSEYRDRDSRATFASYYSAVGGGDRDSVLSTLHDYGYNSAGSPRVSEPGLQLDKMQVHRKGSSSTVNEEKVSGGCFISMTPEEAAEAKQREQRKVMDKILFGTRVASSVSARNAADRWLACRSGKAKRP